MNLLSTLFPPSSFVELPQGLVGWTGFIALSGVVLFLLWKWRKYNKPLDPRQVLLLVALLVLTVIFSWVPRSGLPLESVTPPPGVPMEPNEPSIMFLSALPWMLAAGLLGPLPAAIVGLLSGFLTGLWQTHSLFSALETALLAIIVLRGFTPELPYNLLTGSCGIRWQQQFCSACFSRSST